MPKQVSKEFVVWLAKQMQDRGWGIRETARNAGLSHTPISFVLGNQEQPSFETCIALAKAFDMPGEDVLRMAGLLPKPPVFDPRTSEMVDHFNALSDDDKNEMLQIARLKRQRAKQNVERRQKA